MLRIHSPATYDLRASKLLFSFSSCSRCSVVIDEQAVGGYEIFSPQSSQTSMELLAIRPALRRALDFISSSDRAAEAPSKRSLPPSTHRDGVTTDVAIAFHAES